MDFHKNLQVLHLHLVLLVRVVLVHQVQRVHQSESAFEVNNAHFDISGCAFRMQSHPRRFAAHEQPDGAPDSQETNMIRAFSRLAKSGKPDPFWGEIAVKTQQVLDALVRSAHADGAPVAV